MKTFFSSKLFRVIWSVTLALLIYFTCPDCFAKPALIKILLTLLVILNIFPFLAEGKGSLKTAFFWFTQLVRIFVGGLFIFSGFIKANDPLGFSYKLKEYFEVFQADTGLAFFEYFAHIALPLAIIICASEIILGVMLLLGVKLRLTLALLFAQIAFFTFLTFYSACYNKVTECGCFGDFWKLKPWDSFWKDVILMIAITILYVGKNHLKEIFVPMLSGSVLFLGIVFSIAFPIYAYRNLPPLDFRAYAPGENIKENMKFPPTYSPAVIETGFIYENLKTGKKEHFNLQNYPWQDTVNWKWAATDNIVVKDAVDKPRITDFTVNDADGNTITDSLLNDKNYSFWLIMHELALTEDSERLMAQISDFYKLVIAENYTFLALTASGASEIDAFKHKHNALYDFATVDNTVLKTMIRSNPGLMLVKDGTVIANWHYNNFPGFSEVKQKYMK